MKILVADDHPVNRNMMQVLLSALGHEVDLAEDGAEACLATERADYDLILMDLHMPVMNGVEAIGVIKARRRQSAKIYMVTADASEESMAVCRAAGVDGIATKPIDVGKLIALTTEVTALKKFA